MHQKLLRRWCDGLLKYQIHDTGDARLDGGLLCPACMRIHGRCADAILPLVAQWQADGDVRCLHAAEALFRWSDNMRRPDGSMNNDVDSSWNGITVFYANALGETLLWYGDVLPPADRTAWTARFAEMVAYLYHHTEVILENNINYSVSCAYTMALAQRILGGDGRYGALARKLARRGAAQLSEDGFLYGEGYPNDTLTAKHCRPVDLGYNVEESLPALVLYARLTGDEAVEATARNLCRSHLAFLLPDGGWDNSFGSRNYKWTWWGSRTSDGCAAAFALLGETEPVFAAAVQRNLEQLDRCTRDGLLYGGPMYHAAGEPPCIHHTFCHAKAVAALVHDGWQPPADLPPLPVETAAGARYYPSVDTVRLIQGDWIADVTGYDFVYLSGGHPTGGMLSLLWHARRGPVLAGSMDPYRQHEPNNMQVPRYASELCSTPRIEVRRQQGRFGSDQDLTAQLQWNGLHTHAVGKLRTASQQEAGCYTFDVTMEEEAVTLTGSCDQPDAEFLLPVITPEGEPLCWQDDHTVRLGSGKTALTVRSDRPIALPREYGTKEHFRRQFDPVGGFQTVVLAVPACGNFTVTLCVEETDQTETTRKGDSQ